MNKTPTAETGDGNAPRLLATHEEILDARLEARIEAREEYEDQQEAWNE